MHIPLPQDSQQRFGHEAIWQAVTSAYHEGRFPPNILLAGPKGIGKATLAFHMARYLFAQGQQEAYQDMTTPMNCQMTAGAHPDLYVLSQDHLPAEERGKEISVERCRALVSFFQQKPMYGQWRVALVDSLDQLHPRGAQSLLKILEEPPERAILILISHHLDRVLPTIRSRCQLFPCAPLEQQDMRRVLRALHLPLTPDMEAVVLEKSQGAVGYGLDLLQLGGAAFYDAMLNMLRALGHQNLTPAFQFAEKFLLKNEVLDPQTSWELGLRTILRWLSTALWHQQQATPGITADDQAILQGLLNHTSLSHLIQAWFQAYRVIEMTNTFHLDKRHAFMCILTSLVTFNQHP